MPLTLPPLPAEKDGIHSDPNSEINALVRDVITKELLAERIYSLMHQILQELKTDSSTQGESDWLAHQIVQRLKIKNDPVMTRRRLVIALVEAAKRAGGAASTRPLSPR